MFDHLVTPSGGKIAESVSDLAKRTGHPEEQVDGVLRKLDDERIVRPVPAAPGQDPVRFRRYEIFHDVLAPTINRAIAAARNNAASGGSGGWPRWPWPCWSSWPPWRWCSPTC